MQPERRVLGPAEVRWNDYVGTAAADDADAVLDRPSLYELAGVDRGRYTILGVDLTIWEDTTTASVYAVDRVAEQLETHGDIDALGQERGEIPVVEFPLPAQAVTEFLDDAFKRIALRLVARGVREHQLVVVPQAG
ncbi:hypothetical protein ACFFOM_04990 [Microlunatus capsulatus]|jgi:hypothetical protein|uniref:Uncharacterized protein n=1 Tax=Microlunatus capsulatus TaxID=99117 RepID=A0ABS4Z4V3_9ACTN|nr:hypothetical protein [Microlunatus capsulatus]MBP2416071.1 hypothetical protein [Microlunatus capsulatus]